MPLKTPGVYIVEMNAFPNSVVAVSTAVPAFIGHTERATNRGVSLAGKPWRIGSMADYETFFGGAPAPVFSLTRVGSGAASGPSAAMPDPSDAPGQQVTVRMNAQQATLSRASGRAGGRFLLHQALRWFFQNGGADCWIVSVGGYGDELVAGDTARGLIGGLAPLLHESEPTMVVVPEAVLLSKADCARVQAALLDHTGQLRNRMAILDVWGGDRDDPHPPGAAIGDFRASLGSHPLDLAAAYHPWLDATLVGLGDVDYSLIPDRADWAALIADELKLDQAPSDREKEKEKQRVAEIRQMLADWVLGGADDARQRLLHQSMALLSPFYRQVLDAARHLLNRMPPSAALAGLWSRVDQSRGVWCAPCDTGFVGVAGPAVALSPAALQDLAEAPEVPRINALVLVDGVAVQVRGEHTLAAGGGDEAQIHRCRTRLMLQESCRLAVQAYANAPNEAATWTIVRSMLENFLGGVWKLGGLAGAVPAEAYEVRLGLGETMTPADVQAGLLRASVRVALARPGAFTEIRIEQAMQLG